MKNWKRLLTCLLACVLVLSMLTACTTNVQQNGAVRASADSTEELCKTLGKKYDATESLSDKAYAIASWMAENLISSGEQSKDGIQLKSATNNEVQNALDRKDYAYAFYLLGATNIGIEDRNVTVGVKIDSVTVSFNDQVWITAPVDGQIPDYMQTAAAGKTEMGAAYIQWNGTRYVVTVFR